MRQFTFPARSCFAGALLALALPAGSWATPVVYSGSGTGTSGLPISATATFELVTHNFGAGAVDAVQITLTNTAESTDLRGNLITGLFFSLADDVGALPTTSAGFDGVAHTVVLSSGGAATNVDIAPAIADSATDGGYQLSNGPFGNANSGLSYSAYEYAIATVGMGLSGFNGRALNGDDFGIFAHGSVTSSGNLSKARPLIDTSAVFWIAVPSSWTSLNQLGDAVRIAYGSQPDNFVDAHREDPPDVPEPASLGLAGIAIAALAVRARRRR